MGDRHPEAVSAGIDATILRRLSVIFDDRAQFQQGA